MAARDSARREGSIRFTTGFGAMFWLLVVAIILGCIVLAVRLVTTEATAISVTLTVVTVGAALILAVTLIRRIQGSATVLEPERGVLRSRGREVSLADITKVTLMSLGRAGNWLVIWVEGEKEFTKLAISRTMFRAAGIRQWQGIQRLLVSSAITHYEPLPTKYTRNDQPPQSLTGADALAVIDAQIQWIATGKSPSSASAPIHALHSMVGISAPQ